MTALSRDRNGGTEVEIYRFEHDIVGSIVTRRYAFFFCNKSYSRSIL